MKSPAQVPLAHSAVVPGFPSVVALVTWASTGPLVGRRAIRQPRMLAATARAGPLALGSLYSRRVSLLR